MSILQTEYSSVHSLSKVKICTHLTLLIASYSYMFCAPSFSLTRVEDSKGCLAA